MDFHGGATGLMGGGWIQEGATIAKFLRKGKPGYRRLFFDQAVISTGPGQNLKGS
jgi:hypothetical protein